ncbi:homoserine O-acetyltransferase family protein [Parapedobacter koreensis]|uniref:Homoserine O-acetyltransferase n=1 Tax=Parapedobacter koreensis TaxID=332977 RepID=A0A1H7LE59_9SPHI|nr:homoserine O-acetyltransferase [Parapedobacter koreensis]SEK97244.1 homoserine O-acetyltransferase [Parapedobacter koreensis]
MSIHTFRYPKTFKLESGKRIKHLEIAYHTYGALNDRKDNVIWVCHALTANSDVFEWWPGLFGDTDFFNPQDYFIVCANIIGSPYGSTNPLSMNPVTGQPYYLSFPQFSIRDLVAVHSLLADHLGIEQIALAIGGSLGGQQALEWAIADPNRIANLVLVATNAVHSPWGIAFNESQRLAIGADRTFYANAPNGGAKGLKAARSIALLSYRGYHAYGATQREASNEKQDDFRASSYQHYQGEKLVKRFNAYSYWLLTKTMDSHNVGRKRASIEDALRQVKANTLVIGISTDLLFPTDEQKYLADHIPGATYAEINSFYGHDGFLMETKHIAEKISGFLACHKPQNTAIYQQMDQQIA